MAREQDVVSLPFKITDFNEDMIPLLNRNFEEVERMLALLQGYVKQATGGAVKDLPASAGVWDRAGNITADGKFLTEKLLGTIETLQNQVNGGGGTVTITDTDGILITDTAVNPTKALRLKGGILAISNEKDGQGNWVWRTFGTGDGFVADEIVSGQILTTLINIIGEGGLVRLVGDGLRIYDNNWNPRVHLGNYEEYGVQTATFSRSSVAYQEE